MALDIAVIVIFAFSTIRGKRQGFMETMFKLLRIILCLVLAVLSCDTVVSMLDAFGLDDFVRDRVQDKAMEGMIDPALLIPNRIGEFLSEVTRGILNTTVRQFTNLVINVTAFLIIVAFTCLVISFLRRKVHKSKMKKGVIGRVDEGVGLVIGALKGVIYVCIFLAFLLPLTGIFMPEKINNMSELLNQSYIAGPLYDINPLLAFVRTLRL